MFQFFCRKRILIQIGDKRFRGSIGYMESNNSEREGIKDRASDRKKGKMDIDRKKSVDVRKLFLKRFCCFILFAGKVKLNGQIKIAIR